MKEFIDWDSIEVKGNRTGSKKAKCPKCIDRRTNKTDRSLSINFDKGVAHCHYCNAVSFRKDETIAQTFTLPPQDWQNHTNLSDALVKWCSGRGIPQRILIEFGITEEKQWMPQTCKDANCIVFNYFEGDKLVNKKFRDGKKNFSQSKDGKKILYNINSIIGAETVYIVEGEFDVLAMAANGIYNVVSLVNGANDHDDQWINSEKYLSDVKRFIIATDADQKGVDVRDKIAHRLGKWRCSYIEWDGCKDANEALLNGTLDDNLKAVATFPVSGTYSVSDLSDGVFDLYRNGLPKTLKPKHQSFDGINSIFSIMKGQLTTVTGIPSHGKSNFVEWYVLNLVNDYDMKASFYSPEHSPMPLHQTTFIEKAIGRNFWNEMEGLPRITEQDIERYVNWADNRIYVTASDTGASVDWEWILSKFKEQLFSYGINIFVVDAFNKVSLPKGNKLDAINQVLTDLTAFAQVNDVSVILVAHPTKMKKKEGSTDYEMPTLYDVSGSADFRNQTHNGFTIHRIFGDDPRTIFVNTKTKFKFQGKIGDETELTYDIPTGRYYQKGTSAPRFDMTIPHEQQFLTTAMRPNTSFEDEQLEEIEDVPF